MRKEGWHKCDSRRGTQLGEENARTTAQATAFLGGARMTSERCGKTHGSRLCAGERVFLGFGSILDLKRGSETLQIDCETFHSLLLWGLPFSDFGWAQIGRKRRNSSQSRLIGRSETFEIARETLPTIEERMGNVADSLKNVSYEP
ncbi:hypothetical protein L596_022056 [Steinernema carpocapsae]|uniref:Uncharacterized protein n=1 Tax=Steinernema carpocapsae TaxID=34508 RepID=A0A4U5MKL1_STECR|nr:hypothetical protein L596_022056 [Steinernema carpocapsae]